MLLAPEPPPIPYHRSDLEGVSIEIESFADNLAFDGRGDHALEDWFWQITVANTSHPFCTVKGYWGLYVVRSLHPVDLQFNTPDNSTVIQLWPGDEPRQFMVKEDTDGEHTGICLITFFERPGVGTIRHTRGLYMYHSA